MANFRKARYKLFLHILLICNYELDNKYIKVSSLKSIIDISHMLCMQIYIYTFLKHDKFISALC